MFSPACLSCGAFFTGKSRAPVVPATYAFPALSRAKACGTVFDDPPISERQRTLFPPGAYLVKYPLKTAAESGLPPTGVP
jgi:hypothetical protein